MNIESIENADICFRIPHIFIHFTYGNKRENIYASFENKLQNEAEKS